VTSVQGDKERKTHAHTYIHTYIRAYMHNQIIGWMLKKVVIEGTCAKYLSSVRVENSFHPNSL
jgi:hypothetical protein